VHGRNRSDRQPHPHADRQSGNLDDGHEHMVTVQLSNAVRRRGAEGFQASILADEDG